MLYYRRTPKKYHSNTVTYKNHKKHKYCTDIFCFDIEVSSYWLNENGDIIEYKKGKDADYWNELTPCALPYIFMFSVNETVYYGREFSDFYDLLTMLPCDMDIIIWVHNLAYEFQFLCNLLKWKSVFARASHKVIKCVPADFPNIEFRCTYFLTRLSLANWGKQIGVFKKTGDLDYTKLRTPYTKLTDTEMMYCEMDCLVMYAGIKQYREQYETLQNIPLTQTGTVRRVVKNRLSNDYRYMCHVKQLVPNNATEYAMLQRIFSGGYTHANRLYAGKTIRGLIEHRDFASAYPVAMLSEKYPNTKWTYCKLKSIPNDFDDYAYILHIAYTNIVCATFNTYIQASKCIDSKNARFDNGRLISADYVELWMTEQDYDIIRRMYDYDFEILHAYKSKKDYLPRALLEYLLELYHNKTALKNVAGSEPLYLQSKQYINSLFGMMVTAILQSDVTFKNDEWNMQTLTSAQINERLHDLKNISPKENRYFLSYSWGIYVTAYCRHNLFDCILKYDDLVLYADTDSIFMLGHGDFSEYNKNIQEKVKKSCIANNLNIEKTRPVDTHGVTHEIGLFEKENDCTEFITLGAKRYCYRDVADGKLKLTISGINKDAVQLLDDNIDNFRDGFVFDKDADCVHKMLLTYSCNMPETHFTDGYVSHYRYGINMRNNGYKLSITNEYAELIKYMNICFNDMPLADNISRRGRFKK